MRGVKLTKKKEKLYKSIFLDVFNKHYGILFPTITFLEEKHKEINISWRFYHDKWMKWDEEYLAEVNNIQYGAIETVETAAFQKAIMESDGPMIKFILERRGGYREETKQEISLNTPVKINIIKPNEETE